MNVIKNLIFDLIESKINESADTYMDSPSIEKIVIDLEQQSGKNFGDDVEKWARWYFEESSDSEKDFVRAAYGIYRTRKNFDKNI